MPVCLHEEGRDINPDLAGKNVPWAPSVDHIVPRSLGGTSLMRNLRAAHRLCNAKAAHRLYLISPRSDLFPGDQGSRWS